MQKGIIINLISNMYIVKSEEKDYTCTARGKFKKEDISPVVGDRVEIEITDVQSNIAVINEILPRDNYIKRPKMANLTQIILVVSLSHPKPDLLMLDKQLAFLEFLGIKPIIVLNKIDLEKEEKIIEIKEIYENIGYKVICTNAKEKIGVQALKQILEGNISAFSGNSGVGKSTLLNKLFEDNLTLEGNISTKNKKGKNTTTVVTLYELKEGTYIADTPGFSNFDIYEIETRNLYKYFKEFKKLEQDCEFVGCTHIKENNCGIKEAVKNEKIASTRYANYVKIYEDLKDREEHKW